MKISQRTLDILKNYAMINPGIVVTPGNILRTIHPLEAMQACATVQEKFEQEFAIGNLPRFLSVISLFKEPDFTFNKNSVLIKEGKQEVEYVYSDKEVVVYQADDPPIYTSDIAFKIQNQVLTSISKALSIMQLQKLAIIGDGKKLILRGVDNKGISADTFSYDITETTENFYALLSIEYIKFVDNDYDVIQNPKGATMFKSSDITYWVANDKFEQYDKAA